MKTLLLAALTAYIVAAIHSVLAFAYKRRKLENVTLYSLAFGLGLHTIALAGDWFADGHYPVFGLREALSFLAWTLAGSYFIVWYRYQAQAVGTLTLPLVALLLTIVVLGMPVSDAGSREAVQLAQSKWFLPLHTTLWIFGYASLFVVFAASVMYLWQERELKLKTFSAFFHRLPSLTTVNDIAASTTGIGFTLLTLGLITGMLLSSERTGRVWNNDPKEIFAATTWLFYLALICYRATASWRGRRAAWLGVIGFGLALCTFFGARMLGGYHLFG